MAIGITIFQLNLYNKGAMILIINNVYKNHNAPITPLSDLLSYMNIALLNLRKYNKFARLNNTPFEKERRTMSKTNIKCPRCNSDKLYKFG
ncbi:hypothetical protein, partial [Clostridium saudiense]